MYPQEAMAKAWFPCGLVACVWMQLILSFSGRAGNEKPEPHVISLY